MVRSKNAGPYTLTIDLMFADPSDAVQLYGQLISGQVQPRLGSLADSNVTIHLNRTAAAVKITTGRSIPAGSFGDTDIYGCQQHVGMLEVLGLLGPASSGDS